VILINIGLDLLNLYFLVLYLTYFIIAYRIIPTVISISAPLLIELKGLMAITKASLNSVMAITY
jgi:hypothetical protein